MKFPKEKGYVGEEVDGENEIRQDCVKAVVQQNREELVKDSSLDCCPSDEINHAFNIALMCLEPEPSKRPTMAERSFFILEDKERTPENEKGTMEDSGADFLEWPALWLPIPAYQ
ncbi:hypothetical protein Vadar_010160 [Vaccinium darrowii]|uniref:Uncharacterized protein n=1 Tax=Vaccinium darrowii TaxID=229202 RepID=A0ACB7XY23_9ERIC|nr:hypothetical protein Vadar_010160 [Vaccinium darrowii]